MLHLYTLQYQSKVCGQYIFYLFIYFFFLKKRILLCTLCIFGPETSILFSIYNKKMFIEQQISIL